MTESKLREMAQDGLRRIGESIVGLLMLNTHGMTNAEIARELGISTQINGQHRNWLTRSILDGLETQGRVFLVDRRWVIRS